MKKKKELNGGMSGRRGRRRCRRGGKGMQLYAKFLAIFHGKAIQATAADGRGLRRQRRGEKAMTTVILIVLLTCLNHQEDGRQRGRDEEEAEA